MHLFLQTAKNTALAKKKKNSTSMLHLKMSLHEVILKTTIRID